MTVSGKQARRSEFDADQPAFVDFRLQVRERTKPLVFWIGAGVSAGAGLPTWASLRTALASSLLGKAETLQEAARTGLYDSVKAIESLPSAWIAFKKLREALGEQSFQSVIRSELSRHTTAPVPELTP